MRNKAFLAVMVGILVSFTLPLEAQGIWSGYLQTDNRLRLNDSYEFSWQEQKFGSGHGVFLQ
jgi:hypothetical protein